jgi:hypothetical protein
MIEFTSRGSWDKTERFLAFLSKGSFFDRIASYAQRGVDALASATPQDTGETAGSWSYEVQRSSGGVTIFWINTHLDAAGTPIAIMLQTGHGTGTGGFVQGRDYINPAIRPVFDEIADAVWKEVTSA